MFPRGKARRSARFCFCGGEADVGDCGPMEKRVLRSLMVWVLPALALSSCGTVEFYAQAARGQWEVMSRSRPIPEVLADPGTSVELRRKLTAVQGMRAFASGHLGLPGDESYGTYADLGREHVTWVLYAAPEFSLEPKTWWYPTLGRLDYRGFFCEADAQDAARRMREQGLDVVVGGVDAYSTLGWFHDPVLNCFATYPEIDLAELVFHELTHRRLFRKGDTAFNEALATAYAEDGVKRWLIHQGRQRDLRRYAGLVLRRERFYQEIARTRGRLEALYASKLQPAAMRREKSRILSGLQDVLRNLRREWGGRGLESWLEGELNNAHLVSILTYQEHEPAFHQLLRECGGDPADFFERASRLELRGSAGRAPVGPGG